MPSDNQLGSVSCCLAIALSGFSGLASEESKSMKTRLTMAPLFCRPLMALIAAAALSFGSFAIASTDSAGAEFRSAPLVSIPTHDRFFEAIRAHCGKAYAGKIAVDNAPSDAFANKALVMFVRRCSDSELQIPFYVGDDKSRTWIIKKTGSGLSLKHDHRHDDGSMDELTMYGGHTLDAGFSEVQSFPADQYSKELFVRSGIPQSVTNIWQMFIYPESFSYRLIREGREFRVDFDLTAPVAAPSAPWGYYD